MSRLFSGTVLDCSSRPALSLIAPPHQLESPTIRPSLPSFPSLNAPPPRPCRSFVAVYARSPPLDLGYYSSLRCSYAPLPLFLSCSCAPVLSPPPPSRRSSYSLFMNTLHSLYTVPLIPSTYSAHPDHAHCYFELHCWPGYPVVAKVSGTFICGEALEVHFADGCRCDG